MARKYPLDRGGKHPQDPLGHGGRDRRAPARLVSRSAGRARG